MPAENVDARGTAHAPAGPDARIVSLVPSVTELLFALGLDRFVVGRTGFCIHPRERVRAVPKVGGTKAVKLDAVRALRPTHLIVNVDENEKATIDALAESVPHIVVTHPLTPRDNLALYALIGAIFGCQDAARRLGEALRARLDALSAMQWPERRVLYVIWRDPWMTVARDTYISSMLGLVNWQTLPAVTGGRAGSARYPSFELSAAWMADVDDVLLSSEPYRFTERHREALAADPQLAGKTVRLIDGEMVSWYGARAVDGLDYLRRLALDG
jgi:ABC-type Fe3+-hydroxamate transport system substrate-binding protein